MKIYVDYDDCLCETARYFSVLVQDMFGLDVPYENIRYFNLQKSFKLSDEDFDRMMVKAHEADELLSLKETEGASSVINEWVNKGHEVSVITGRPFNSYEASREWLDRHGYKDIRLYCLNKYGRENFLGECDFSLELDEYYKMKFDFAIEDSPLAFKYFDHLPDLKVMVYDRPWNRQEDLPDANYRRCTDWKMIRECVNL